VIGQNFEGKFASATVGWEDFFICGKSVPFVYLLYLVNEYVTFQKNFLVDEGEVLSATGPLCK
jgi:hypothetical protein